MDPSYKPHIALDTYSTMQHFVTEMCTYVHISVTKRCIVGVGYLSNALWTLHSRSYIDCSFDNQVTLTDIGKITDFKRQHDTAKLEPCAHKSWDILHVGNLEPSVFCVQNISQTFMFCWQRHKQEVYSSRVHTRLLWFQVPFLWNVEILSEILKIA